MTPRTPAWEHSLIKKAVPHAREETVHPGRRDGKRSQQRHPERRSLGGDHEMEHSLHQPARSYTADLPISRITATVARHADSPSSVPRIFDLT
jgi:hypothetical protein